MRKPRGRPRSVGESFSETCIFRVTPSEKRAIERYCVLQGAGLSAVFRHILSVVVVAALDVEDNTSVFPAAVHHPVWSEMFLAWDAYRDDGALGTPGAWRTVQYLTESEEDAAPSKEVRKRVSVPKVPVAKRLGLRQVAELLWEDLEWVTLFGGTFASEDDAVKETLPNARNVRGIQDWLHSKHLVVASIPHIRYGLEGVLNDSRNALRVPTVGAT